MNNNQPTTEFAERIIEQYPDKDWTPSRMSLLDMFGRFMSYTYKLIREDKYDSPVERRNWRYNSLKQLQKYNNYVYDLLSDEHKEQIQFLETNRQSIIDYEELFVELVFMY